MLFSALLASALVFTEADAQHAYAVATNLVSVATPRAAGTCGAAHAARVLGDAASRAGFDLSVDLFTDETRTGARVFRNLLYFHKGGAATEPALVFVSHYDTKPNVDCPGANDGASTSGLLIALAASVIRANYSHNVIFLWTDGEECAVSYGPHDGLHGSRHAARVFAREKRALAGVYVLDMLGDANLVVSLPLNGDARMRCAALRLAAEKVPELKMQVVDWACLDDHVPFLEAGYPALNLIDFQYGSAPHANDWWHTAADTCDKISPRSLQRVGAWAVACLNAREATKGADGTKAN